MFRAARGYAGAKPPTWLTTLILAKEWGVPPHILAKEPGVLKWVARWNAWQEQVNKSADMDRKQAESRARMDKVR